MKAKFTIAAAAIAGSLFGAAANAATFSYDAVPTTGSAIAPGATVSYTGAAGIDTVALVSGEKRSPFYDDVTNPSPTDSYYYAMVSGTVTLAYASAQNSLQFIWGSPDAYNELTFWLNGVAVETVTPTPANGLVPVYSTGAKYVTIVPTSSFDSVSFTTVNQNAFEFANVTAAVPVPAAGVLLLGALGGLGFVARKRRA